MKKLITILSFLLVGISIQAQDFFFSQFHLSPLNLNPALTGTSGQDQLIVNYRDQWRNLLGDAAFKTFSFSYDKPLQLKNGDRIGVGARFLNEDAGSAPFFNRGGSLFFSYQKRIFQTKKFEQFLIGGIEGGFYRRSLDFIGTNQISSFSDFDLGLSYLLKFGEQRSFNLGFSLGHVFEPSFISRTFNAFAMFDLKLYKKWSLSPRFSYLRVVGFDLLVASASLNIPIGINRFEATFGSNFGTEGIVRFYFFSPTFFFNNKFGISTTLEFNTGVLNGDGIETYEGSIIYRFGKKTTEIPE